LNEVLLDASTLQIGVLKDVVKRIVPGKGLDILGLLDPKRGGRSPTKK